MRLLRYNEDGKIVIEHFNDGHVPPYAILSHTWGAEKEEVTFANINNGDGLDKAGYEKIRFCGTQARHDGLQYFWVDSCCIDTTDNAEHSHAIRSMFRWYQAAAKCYVYLSDVRIRKRKFESTADESTWERAFKLSRWFKRGWTLQELLAPRVVEFFSQEGDRLGDKLSLKCLINKITCIPSETLDGASLSQFSFDERLRWKGNRETKRPEDAWYSMTGIFGVELAPAYSEGAVSAFTRLKGEFDLTAKCTRDLRCTSPDDDKKRIEDTKGGLLVDSFRWVLDNDTFQQWRRDAGSRLLWVKGDPGKGKTMLLCGIINELQKAANNTMTVSYFFCQATDSRINNAKAVLRGLLYMLVRQRPSLASHIRKKYDLAGKTLFEDANAWMALTDIWLDVIQDPSLSETCLIIDALDECITDLPKLLDFIAGQSLASSCVKWIVSSRNWPDIEEKLEQAGHKIKLSLELNAKSVAIAVQTFIQQKVDQLAQEKQYQEELQSAVLDHLISNANDTFLWVALVYEELKKTKKRHVLQKLKQFPTGLNALYERMMDLISQSDDAETCRSVLACTTILYRPVTVPELVSVAEQLGGLVHDLDSVREIISLCGSFLTLREDTVYFVHQSAKDFLFTTARERVFLRGIEAIHREVFSKSLANLYKTLHRDMYSLKELGSPVESINPRDPDPLIALRYPCVYWIDHLCESEPEYPRNSINAQQVWESVNDFIKKRYLYWLEGLSLCKSVEKGVVSMTKLCSLMQEIPDHDEFTQLVQDAQRFIMYHKGAIRGYPLQAYTSTLLFSPTNSLIRHQFQHEEPKGITIKPAMSDNWSACLQTLEGHSGRVTSVAFSHDSTRIASASDDKTIKIWDASNGERLHTLKGHNGSVRSIAFSHDSTRIASASDDKTVKIWDVNSGKHLHTLQSNSYQEISVAFSLDSSRIASVSDDETVEIWDASSGKHLHALKGHNRYVYSVAFSHDSTRIASASRDKTVKIWDTSSGKHLHTLKGHNRYVYSVAFSHDSTRIASASSDNTVKIWDSSSGEHLHTLKGHSGVVSSVAFSYNSMRLASASWDRTVKIWDTSSGKHLHTLSGHSDSVSSVACSSNSTQIASASWDMTVKIWDVSSSEHLHTLKDYSHQVSFKASSYDLTWIALASDEKTVEIWDASSCEHLHTLKGHSGHVYSVAFSHDSTRIASASDDKTIKIWDASNGERLHTLKGHDGRVRSIAFSHDSTRIASVSDDNTVKIWDASSGEHLHTLKQSRIPGTSRSWRRPVAFSHNSTRIASVSEDDTVNIWDASSGEHLRTLQGCGSWVSLLAFSHDSTQITSASNRKQVKIWDTRSGEHLYTLEGHSGPVNLVAFSPDSTKLASASGDSTVKIWDASSGACLSTLDVGCSLSTLSFDSTGSVLYTEIGTIALHSMGAISAGNLATPAHPQYIGIGLSPDRKWITYEGRNVLWVPSEYRPSSSFVRGNRIGIFDGSGKVWFCSITA